MWPLVQGRGAGPEQRVLAACLLPQGSAGPAGSGMGVAAAAVAPAASNICGVGSIPKVANSHADPRSWLWDRQYAGGLHLSSPGLQTTCVCSRWDMSPFLGGCWLQPWGWARGHILGYPSHSRFLLVQGGRLFPAWRKKSIFWWMYWPGKRLLAPTHSRMASPGVSACSLLPLLSVAVPGTLQQPPSAPQAGLPSGAIRVLLCLLLQPPWSLLAADSTWPAG